MNILNFRQPFLIGGALGGITSIIGIGFDFAIGILESSSNLISTTLESAAGFIESLNLRDIVVLILLLLFIFQVVRSVWTIFFKPISDSAKKITEEEKVKFVGENSIFANILDEYGKEKIKASLTTEKTEIIDLMWGTLIVSGIILMPVQVLGMFSAVFEFMILMLVMVLKVVRGLF